MENDDKEKKLYNFSENKDNIFTSEYKGQSIKNNINYKNWENSMLEKYGKDAKLFHCQEDDILYYVSNKECMEYPYYCTRCPKCNYFICYYCETMTNHDKAEFGKCCLKRRLYYSFHQDSQEYINPIGPFAEYAGTFHSFIFLIPFVNLVYIIACISTLLFYKLNLKYKDDNHEYEYRLKDKCFFTFEIFFVLNCLFAIVLSISYILINIYFLLFLWLISFPFKLIPIKYVAGILSRGLAG